MSDTVLALILTVLILLALAAWAPVLHAAETIALRYARGRTTVRSQEDVPEESRTEYAGEVA